MEQYKSFGYEVKDVDTSAGLVEMYVNAFDNEDTDGDISAKGSFTKTIGENFKRIKHFLNHDSTILLGLPLEIKQDDFGLLVRSKMNKEKEIVRDTLSDYRLYKDNGRTLEHSIGYNVVRRDDKNTKIITEYRLREYSTLTSWGANMNTPLVGIKSADDFITKMDELVQQYNARYSDKRLAAIERELITLNKAAPYLTTLFVKGVEGDTHFDEPNHETEIVAALKSIRQSLNI